MPHPFHFAFYVKDLASTRRFYAGQLAARLERAGVAFIISPRTRYAGQPGEQSTMFLQDESGTRSK